MSFVRYFWTFIWDENLLWYLGKQTSQFLLVHNRFFLSLPDKKVNYSKFSFQNFVITSQNNVQEDMNKFKVLQNIQIKQETQ